MGNHYKTAMGSGSVRPAAAMQPGRNFDTPADGNSAAFGGTWTADGNYASAGLTRLAHELAFVRLEEN